MLTVRQRGPNWYVRGTVRGEGKKKERVPEQRTGCDSAAAAEQFARKLEAEIKARLTLNIAPPKPEERVSFADAVTTYISLKQPKNGDLWRLQKLLNGFEDKLLPEIDATAWTTFCATHLPGTHANTRARYQTTLRGVFSLAGGNIKFPADIKHNAKRVERVRWLQKDEADRLVDAYETGQNPSARAIALTLRFLGVRSSECSQLQRNQYDSKRGPFGAIWIEPSKNGQPRWVPLHERVLEAWEPLLSEKRPVYLVAGKPRDPVFLTDKRKPYIDRRISDCGGNPFARMHNGAVARAGVDDFTPHDWRHHWASWHVREGMDLRTLQTLGGWLELSMVQRYAAVDFDDAAMKMARAS
jgi:integrase